MRFLLALLSTLLIACAASTSVLAASSVQCSNMVVGGTGSCGTLGFTGTNPNAVNFTNMTFSNVLNDQHAGTYAIVTGDNTKLVLLGAFTYTIPQAGPPGFSSGWHTCLLNIASSGNSTITATTSVFNGATGTTSLTLAPGDWACPTSDAVNYDTMVGHYVGGGSGTTGIAAAGTTLSGATTLTTQQNFVSSGANCTTYNPAASSGGCAGQAAVKVGSTLMIPFNSIYVTNKDPTNALLIYPDATGHTINNQPAGVGMALQANSTAHLIVESTSALWSVP